MKPIKNTFIYAGMAFLALAGTYGYLANAAALYGDNEPAPTDQLSLSPVTRTVNLGQESSHYVSLPANPSALDSRCYRYYSDSVPASQNNSLAEYCDISVVNDYSIKPSIYPATNQALAGKASIIKTEKKSVTVQASAEGGYTLSVPVRIVSCINDTSNTCQAPQWEKNVTLYATLAAKQSVGGNPSQLRAETTYTVARSSSSLAITAAQKDFSFNFASSNTQTASTAITVTPVNMKTWKVENPSVPEALKGYIVPALNTSGTLLSIQAFGNKFPAGTTAMGALTISANGTGNDGMPHSTSTAVQITLTKSAATGQLSCTLSATPLSGKAPLSTTLAITASGGKAPYILHQFDFTNDGRYEIAQWGNSASTIYPSAGTYAAAGQVTDLDGKTAQCQQAVQVSSGDSGFTLSVLNPSNKTGVIAKVPGSAAYTLNIGRTNFTGGILLGTTLPSGMSASFSQNPAISASQVTMTVSAAAGKSGMINFNVTGTGIGNGKSASDSATVIVGSGQTIQDCGCKLAAQRVPFSKDMYLRWNCTGTKPDSLFVMGQEGSRSWLVNDAPLAWPTNGSTPLTDKSSTTGGALKGPQGGDVSYGVYCTSDVRAGI